MVASPVDEGSHDEVAGCQNRHPFGATRITSEKRSRRGSDVGADTVEIGDLLQGFVIDDHLREKID